MTHMRRMRNDCKVMHRKIKEIKRDIAEIMRIRFGQVVDINELEEKDIQDTMGVRFDNIINIDDMEEALLKCVVHDLRMDVADIKSLYVDEIKMLTVSNAK